MMAPARMNSGIASSGKLVEPSNMTSATLGSMSDALHQDDRGHGDEAEGHGDRNVEQDQGEQAAEHETDGHRRGPP